MKKLQLLFCLLFGATFAFSQTLPELMYFKFDATTSGTVLNEAPPATRAGSLNAPLVGTITTGGVGQFNTALLGLTTDLDYVNTGWNTNLVSTDWTIGFWINNFSSGTTLWYLFGDPGNSLRCFINGAPGAGNMRLSGTGVPTTTVTGVTGGPYYIHIVRTVSPNELKFYKNGVLQSTTAITGTMTVGTGLRIGSYTSGGIDGQMDEFRIYNRALSATEIGATWNKQLGDKPGNNASVGELVAPLGTVCLTNQDIKVRVKNTGKNVINNLTVQWSIDGVGQSPIIITNPLDTVGGTTYSSDTVITLGNQFIGNTPISIVAYTENPNSVADTSTSDDTLRVTLRSGLSGAYTIGGIGADYATIAAAVDDLNAYGICSSVTFTVDSAAGPYNSAINLKSINGSSASKTITFNGNGSIITSALSPVVGFTGSSYVTMNGFNIVNTGSVGYGVQVSQSAHHLTFTNNTITVSGTSTTATSAGFVASGSPTAPTTAGNNVQYLTFTNNTITGGYHSFVVMGNTGPADSYGHYIANNVLKGFYAYGLYLGNSDSSVVLNNDISRIGRSTFTTFYGIYLGTSRYIKAHKNRIHDVGGASAAYPFYITNTVNSPGYEMEIYNNAIYNLNCTSTMYGMYFLTTATTGVNIYHNTIEYNVPSGTGASRGIFLNATNTNVNIRNNIISITGAGTGVKTGIYVTTISASIISNNNVINVNSSATNNIGYWGAVNATLANWQTASGQDLASVSVDPLFLDLPNGRLQPTAFAARGIGVPLGFTEDIVGNARSSTKPDPGAFESIKAYNDAGVQPSTALLSCSTPQDIKVNLVNYGKNQLTSVLVEWTANGVPMSPYSVTFTVDTAESVAGDDTVIVIGQIIPSLGANDTIVVWTSMPNGVADTTRNNDTAKFVMKPGFASGVYSIGPGGNYTTITAALAAINNGVCGPVTLELMSSYSSATETYPFVIPESLNPLNTITIRPQAGASALTISGSNATAIFDLNKSKYVTIDGRPGGTGTTGELSIINTSTAGATIRFINGASNNTLRYLTVTGNNATAASGVIVFGGTTSTTGNNNNLIDNCNINGNSASVNCIYASGSAAPADNIGNTITNNNIYDFFANVASTEISGIALMGGCSNWVIGTPGNGNRFYQTAARNATSVPALTNIGLFKAIYINSTTVGGCSIVGNRIGGNIPGIPGSVFIIGDAATSVGHTLRLIDNNASSPTVANSIQGNTISDITMNSTVSNAFIGVHARSGIVNVGNITGNMFGSQTGTGSINIYHNNTTTGANAYAIRIEAASGLIQNNLIGSMNAEVRTAAGGLQLLCIYLSGSLPGPLTISDNTVGGTTLNSIQSTATSLGNVNVMGICASAATASLVTINNNLVRNLSGLNSTTGTNNGVKGIYFTGASSVGSVISNNTVVGLTSSSGNLGLDQTASIIGITSVNSSGNHIVTGNTVYGLHTNASSAGVYVYGILVNGATTGAITVEKNRIFGLTATGTNTAATLTGITTGAAVTTKVSIWNNMISLGTDSAGAAFTGPVTLTGIYKTGKASVIHNTVKIDGAGVGSSVNNSFGYNTLANSAGDSVVNNIFINLRMNGGSGGNHYAVGLPNATNVYANYNLYYVNSATLGLFNGIAQANFANWQATSTLDANSVNTTSNFASFSDLHLTGPSVGDIALSGMQVVYVATDIDNAVRTNMPYMGADEAAIPLPVKWLDFTANAVDGDVFLNWTTASEINSAYFNIMASVDGKTFTDVGRVKAKGYSNTVVNYGFKHSGAQQWANTSPVVYYQLQSIDNDRSVSLSEIVAVNFENDQQLEQTAVFPNPFNDKLSILVPASSTDKLNIRVTDITGKEIAVFKRDLTAGMNRLEISELKDLGKGIYLLQLSNGIESRTVKLIRE